MKLLLNFEMNIVLCCLFVAVVMTCHTVQYSAAFTQHYEAWRCRSTC